MKSSKYDFFEKVSFLKLTLSVEHNFLKRKHVLKNGTRVDFIDNGVLYFQPKGHQTAENVLLSVGVHGNETAPIEMLDELVDDIFNNKALVEQNLLIVIANPRAIIVGKRFITENMNRLFQRIAPELTYNYERYRASQLAGYVAEFFEKNTNRNYHYDLHTAIRKSAYEKFAISPNNNSAQLAEEFQLLKHAGVEAVIMTRSKSGTFSAYTAGQCNAISFTIELGKTMPFGENHLNNFTDFSKFLREKIGWPLKNFSLKEYPKLFRVSRELLKQSEMFRLCFPKDAENFTQCAVGTVLAKDQNYEYKVENDEERFVFPNADVAIGQRALVIIKPVDSELS